MDTKQAYVFDNDGFLDTNKKVRVLVPADVIEDLREIRAEITRVNEAAGRTVFNPAATDALNALILACVNVPAAEAEEVRP